MSDAAAAATGAEGDTDGAGATADTAPVRRWLGRWPAGPTGAGHPVRQAGGWRLGAVGLAVLGLLVGTLVLFGASLTVALHSTQSYHFNLNWTAAFRDALAAGELYPRWLPSMWGGAGGPDFFFYAPMPYFLAAGLGGLAGAPDWQALALAGWAMHAAAALGMLHLGHRLGLGLWPALAMAAVYSVLPYHLIVWNERGALGEAAACVALAPAVAATIDTLGRGRGHWRLTLSVAFLGLSHLPALLIAATGCGAVALAMWRQWTPARVAAAGLAAILGLGLAAVYWVPAVALMDSVQADVMLTYSWREHLLQPASFDASAFLDRILMLALALTLLAVAMLALLWPRAGRLAEGTPDTPAPVAATPVGAATVGALLVGTAILLMSPLATLLWAATPLERIQFPWRFLLLTDLGVAVLAGAGVAAFRAAGAWRRAGLGLAALALGGIALAGQARVLTHGPKAPLYPALLELRSGPPEWLGADRGFFTATTLLEGTPPILADLASAPPLAVEGAGAAAAIEAEAPHAVRVIADCPSGCRIRVRRHYWAYWTMTDTAGRRVAIRDGGAFPLIVADLPPGRGTYDLRLTMPAAVGWGWAVSTVALLGLAVQQVGLWRWRHPRRAAPTDDATEI